MSYKYIDMHCDSLLHCLEDGELYDHPGNMLDISRMVSAGQGAQFFAVFFLPKPDGSKPPPGVVIPVFPEDDEYFKLASNILRENIARHSDVIGLALNAADVEQHSRENRCSAILTIEDGRAVLGDMKKLRYFYDAGVRAMSLTWNSANCFGSPNSMESDIMNAGLTEFGRDAIAEMNTMGMLIDVSHLSDGGFWDIIKLSKKPIVATHSNCRALCGHQRNLTDDMIVALAENGGVSGINFAAMFLAEHGGEHSTVEDLCRHVLHFINIGGEDCVGLGTDFDGISGTFEIGQPTEMHLLFDSLRNKGLTERQIEKFAFGNVLRLLRDTL